MPPQGFDHYVLHILQLVGPPALLVGIGHLGRWGINKLRRVLVGVCGHDGCTNSSGLLSSVSHVVFT